MRQIALDTETTGLSPAHGHRLIEIGCIELVDRKLTGRHFHAYLNPQREIDEGAFKVHGISRDFLKDKPLFKKIAKDFLAFVQDAELLIHNAPFDVGFLNAELKRLQYPKNLEQHCNIVDTLVLAKEKHPGQRNSLDALCKRYQVDLSQRQLHGALLDADLLAQVYLAMTGGQGQLFDEGLASDKVIAQSAAMLAKTTIETPFVMATTDELAAHQSMVDFLLKKSGVDYWTKEFDSCA